MHPEFIETIVLIVDQLRRDNAYIVLFVENVIEFNKVIHDRIVSSIASLVGTDIQRFHQIKRRIKFVNYRLYYQVAEAAMIALDTFPYGGKGCIY